MSSRGFGDPRERPGAISDRPFLDPAGSRPKEPGLLARGADQVYDPAGSRPKDPTLTERPYDPAGTRANIPSERELARFTGIATRLNTTTSDLAQSYEKAYKVNDNLTFGEFIAANVVAANLGSRYPKVTTGNILLGYQNTKGLGKILKSLGVSAAEAEKVESLANQQLAWTRLTR